MFIILGIILILSPETRQQLEVYAPGWGWHTDMSTAALPQQQQTTTPTPMTSTATHRLPVMPGAAVPSRLQPTAQQYPPVPAGAAYYPSGTAGVLSQSSAPGGGVPAAPGTSTWPSGTSSLQRPGAAGVQTYPTAPGTNTWPAGFSSQQYPASAGVPSPGAHSWPSPSGVYPLQHPVQAYPASWSAVTSSQQQPHQYPATARPPLQLYPYIGPTERYPVTFPSQQFQPWWPPSTPPTNTITPPTPTTATIPVSTPAPISVASTAGVGTALTNLLRAKAELVRSALRGSVNAVLWLPRTILDAFLSRTQTVPT